MHPTKLTPVLALLLITAVALAQVPSANPEPLALTLGTKPTVLYDGCYPNACVRTLMSDHWPFSSTPLKALVAIGSPAFADRYSLANQLDYLGVTLDTLRNNWFSRPITPGNIRSGLGGATTGIGIGFTALGEFAATLDNGVGGGLALARYNTGTNDLRVTETWTTNNFGIINPSDWVNGWTLSANLTLKDDENSKYYWIFVHAFAVYSNRTHAGGGRGVALNLTIGNYGSSPSYPPEKWILLPFTPSDIKPFTIVYDSPRLLIATGGVKKVIDLTILNDNLLGAYVVIDVNFTLIFPKAWPYAIVYYNYSVSASILSKLLAYPMYLNSTAFSIRFEIDQVNGASSPGTYNATIFTTNSCGGEEYTLLHATPFDTNFRNITMFAAAYPSATEFTPYRLSKLVPYRTNRFNIVLPTDYRRATLASEGGTPGVIPFVILQWKRDFGDEKVAVAGFNTTYSDGVMFIYGYAYNSTDWAAANEEDPYIKNLIEYTVFHLPVLSGACLSVNPKVAVAGSMSDPTDVLGLAYTYAPWFGLDIAPGAFQNLYTGRAATGIYNFIGLRHFGGLPVVLARLRSSFPYFYDAYYRFGLNQTFVLNSERPMGRYDDYTVNATITVGGPFVNMLTRYAQDFAWYAPFIHNYTSAPFPFTFNNYYVVHNPLVGSLYVPVWNSAVQFTANDTWPPSMALTVGYAIISAAVDPNGTVIVQMWGANAQDTYFAGKLLFDQPSSFRDAPVYIIVFTYKYNWPPYFVIANVYKLTPINSPRLFATFKLGPGVEVGFRP